MENAICYNVSGKHTGDSKLMRSGFGLSLSGKNEWPPRKFVLVRSNEKMTTLPENTITVQDPNPALPNKEKA